MADPDPGTSRRIVRSTTSRMIIANSSSLITTTLVTSALGFVFWWAAARGANQSSVGLGGAAVSAMLFLGTISMLGLGTLLVGEIADYLPVAESFVSSALAISGLAGLLLGSGFALIAPFVSSGLRPIGDGPLPIAIFGIGVATTSASLVLDQATIGLLRAGLQLKRNTVFAVSKLLFVVVAIRWLGVTSGVGILAAWVAGTCVSGLVFVPLLARQGRWRRALPRMDIIWQFRRTALSHHILNVILQAPTLVLPVLIAIVVSVSEAANFYIAWMIAGFLFTVPIALTSVLYAAGDAADEATPGKIRLTLGISLAVGAVASMVSLPGASLLLRAFGANYAGEASTLLRVLIIGVFPLAVRSHYVAVHRIRRELTSAVPLVAIGAALELALAVVGGRLGGVNGFAIAWLIAAIIEALLMTHAVYHATNARRTTIGPSKRRLVNWS